MIRSERVGFLYPGHALERPGAVLYWMNREQRARDSWPLVHALEEGRRLRLPAAVVFTLADALPGGEAGQNRFLLEGLAETAAALERRGIPFFLIEGEPLAGLARLFRKLRPALLVTDFDPRRLRRGLVARLPEIFTGPVAQVDGHNIVPVRHASPKREFAARTLRPKLHRLLPEFLEEFPRLPGQAVPVTFPVPAIDWARLIARERQNPHYPRAGSKAGEVRLKRFLTSGLEAYAAERNDPNRDATSGLSPYLHFGQLAPQRAALAVSALPPGPGVEAFQEELIVRRELADNYCHYTPEYEGYAAFPEWARRTLEAHRRDPREALYTVAELEGAATHDPLWNAAQAHLVRSGRMHGFLRMYWAKKILEWSPDPERALAAAILLNDRYALDGRDPNGYTGIAWSIGGVHDRPWGSREVFGTVRYMSYAGCRRKFAVDAYVARHLP